MLIPHHGFGIRLALCSGGSTMTILRNRLEYFSRMDMAVRYDTSCEKWLIMIVGILGRNGFSIKVYQC